MSAPTPALPWARYLRWMLTTLIAVVALAGAFNVLIDPLGIFGSPRMAGLNATKPYLDHHRELTRWQAARRLCPNTAIFGNSRAEIGFNPEHPAFTAHGLSAFNHSIPGSAVSVAYRQFHWLQSAGCAPNRAIVGVEFFDFLGSVKAAPLPRPDAPPAIDGKVLGETVFSITGLRDSFKTLAIQHARYAATLTERGFNPLDNYIAEVQNSGHYILFRQRAVENKRNWMRKMQAIKPPSGLSIDQQALDQLLADIGASHGKVQLVIYPYHAEIRLMQARLGLTDLFNDWKRMIVAIAADHPGVEVWDFSGITDETLEPIPPAGDHQTQMKYYWESGHFKHELGDKVITRLLGDAPDSHFGVRLTPDNVERVIADDRRQIDTHLATPSPLLTEVGSVVSAH